MLLRQLLNYIERYLVARSTLQDLEAWLLSNLQLILDSREDMTIHLANQIDADLVELGEDIIDEATLRERLEAYAREAQTISLTLSKTEQRVSAHATATAETITSQMEVLGPVRDLHLDHVFA